MTHLKNRRVFPLEIFAYIALAAGLLDDRILVLQLVLMDGDALLLRLSVNVQ